MRLDISLPNMDESFLPTAPNRLYLLLRLILNKDVVSVILSYYIDYYNTIILANHKAIFHWSLIQLEACCVFLKMQTDDPISLQPWLESYIHSTKTMIYLKFSHGSSCCYIWDIRHKRKENTRDKRQRKKRHKNKKQKGPSSLREYWK